VKLGPHGADSVISGDDALFHGGIPEGIGRCLEGSQQWPSVHAAFRHLCQRHPGVVAGPPPFTGLTMAWVSHVQFRLCEYLVVLLSH
jgi:hypothetical protein